MSASSRRYLSVWLRRLSTDRIAKRFPPDALVIAAPVKGALRLSAVNDAAARLGLRVGMPLADARAMYPKLAVADVDESADFVLLDKAQHSAGKDLLDSLRLGDLPGVGMVIIDGQVRIGRSRNTPPAERIAEVAAK